MASRFSFIALLSVSAAMLAGCGGGGNGTSVTANATPKIYVIGASYSSDGPEDARNAAYTAGYRSGDARNVNGAIGQALWVEVLANSLGALTPVSNSRTPTSGQSATNFARGDAHALETRTATAQTLAMVTAGGYAGTPSGQLCVSGICTSTKFPRSAMDQWLTLAATNPTIGSSDVLTIDSGGNDLVYQHLDAHPGVNVTTTDPNFITDRVAVIRNIADKAVVLGFKKIVITRIPKLDALPGVASQNGTGGVDTTKLAADVNTMNSAMDAMRTALKSSNPTLHIYKADWYAAISNVTSAPATYGFPASGTIDAGDDVTVTANSNLIWWDTNQLHPSAKLHKYMADNLITELP